MALIFVDPSAAGDAMAVSDGSKCYFRVGNSYTMSPTVTAVAATSSSCIPCASPPNCYHCGTEPGADNPCCFDNANAFSTISWSFTADTSGWSDKQVASWGRLSSGTLTQRIYQCSTGLGNPNGPSAYFLWSPAVGEGSNNQWVGSIADNTPGGDGDNVFIESAMYGGTQLPLGGDCCGASWSGTAEVFSTFSVLGPCTGSITITISQNYCCCNDTGGCNPDAGACDGDCSDGA